MHQEKPLITRSLSIVLIILGTSLVFFGILFLIYASWDQFSAPGRVATVLFPLIFLYTLSWKLWKNSPFRTNAEHLLLAANIIAPPVIGTLLYQLNVYPTNDIGLIGFSFLLSIPLVLLAKNFAKEKRQVFLLALYAAFSILCFYWHFELSPLLGSFLTLLYGSLFLLIGSKNQTGILPYEQKFQTILGLIASGIGLVWLPLTSLHLSTFSLNQIALFALSSLLFLLLAIYSADLWKRHGDTDFAQSRSIFEIGSPILLVVPVAASAINSDQFIYTALLIFFSIVTLVASYYLAVKTFRFLGWAGLLVSLLPLFGTLFRSLEAFWPIALVGGGLVLISVSIAITNFEIKNALTWFTKEPQAPLFGLGERYQSEVSNPKSETNNSTGSFTIFTIIVFFLIILALID